MGDRRRNERLGARSTARPPERWTAKCLGILVVASTVIAVSASDSRAVASDLPTDAERLARAWSAQPGPGPWRVEHLAPMFVERGRIRTPRLPADAYSSRTTGCTSLAFLAGRSVDFAVHLDPVIVPKHRPTGGTTVRSVAGAALLIRCGAERQALARLAVELRAARGVLDVVMALGPQAASDIATALPERATGPLAAPFDAGPRLPLEPLERRVHEAELRATRAGAMQVERHEIATASEGFGSEAVMLDEGCHRISVMAQAEADTWFDLDAELRDGVSGRVLSRDRSDGADAHLETCVGARSRRMLVYAGAPGRAPLLWLDAVYALPPGVPRSWGPRARGGWSAALFRHRLAPVSGEPRDLRLGTTGLTPLRLLVEPGSCYIAALTALAGAPRLVALTASVDAHQAYDAAMQGQDSAAVAFCVQQVDRVDLQVEMRGTASTWLLASWKVAEVRLGANP